MTTTDFRLGFAGTPALAAIVLEHLLRFPEYQVCRVYTQPDRPAGRGRKLSMSPVKQLAQKHGIPVSQPGKSADFDSVQELTGFDILVVVAYGLILPAAILERPRLGCINVHTSLLPRWRGAAPIQRAIEAGDTETGVSIMQMQAGLDTGPVLHQVRCPVTTTDTSATLHDKLTTLGATALLDTLNNLSQGKDVYPVVQDERLATYAAKISKQEAVLDWSMPAVDLERKIRAFYPAPMAQAEFKQTTFHIQEARVLDQPVNDLPGEIIAYSNEGIDVATAAGVLRMLKIQPAGKRMMTAGEFLNGRPDFFSRSK